MEASDVSGGQNGMGNTRKVRASTAGVTVMLRLSGELSTKSRRTRSRFQRRLVRNLRDALRSQGVRAEVEPSWSRVWVRGPSREILDPLGRVFGVSSFSVLEGECRADLAEIVETGRQIFGHRVRGRRYAVRARRTGRHPFSSSDVMRELGAALNPGATVDLTRPDVVVGVEIRRERAFLFTDRIPGAGGLPTGVQGRAIALLSGGFDSAVAAWMMLRRGVRVDYVFCNLGGAAYRRMVVEVAKVLADRWSYGTHPRLHVLDFSPLVEEMRRRVRSSYLQVVLKTLMYECASQVAAEVGADAIVTGEAIGQVSSQTLQNLRAIEGSPALPILRPLVGFDKEEIVERARRIGTYELSARVREYCALAPGRPVTAARREAVAEQKARVDPALGDAAVAEREVLDLRSLDPVQVVAPGLFVSRIPKDAEVLDTREAEAYIRWHWPSARHVEFEELARDFQRLDREKTYVLCCSEGIRTAHLAERMQAHGFEAYSYRGGARALRRLATRASDAGNGCPEESREEGL